MANKLSFSGHETFHCRHFWLKKGYDFLRQDKHAFNDPESVVDLGVGKNMVASIRFWLRAFSIATEHDELTHLAHYLFGANGKDPYLENVGTLWLLHYHLVTTGSASIYNLVFNKFRRERREFNKQHLETFISRQCREESQSVSPNSIKKDVGVFLKNYLRPRHKSNSVEDDFSAILIDLDLVQELPFAESGGFEWYNIESSEREDIPKEIILYAILDQHGGESSISFQKLLNGDNSVGTVFALNANGLVYKIEELVQAYRDIVFSDDGGIKELQFKKDFNKWDMLDKYYAD